MGNLVWFSGSFLREDQLEFKRFSRAIRYGDGIFETIRIYNGHPLFLEEHFERLSHGMQLLGISSKGLPVLGELESVLYELLASEPAGDAGRLRVQVFRAGQGFDLPESDDAEILIQLFPGESSEYSEKVVQVQIVEGVQLFPSTLTSIKSGNRLPYILAAQEAKRQEAREAIILNSSGRMAEAGSSNIFGVLKDGRICTPPISEGILPGIMRSKLLELLPVWGYSVQEHPIPLDELNSLKELWLTNVIQGVRPVEGLREAGGRSHSFSITLGREILSRLNHWIQAED